MCPWIWIRPFLLEMRSDYNMEAMSSMLSFKKTKMASSAALLQGLVPSPVQKLKGFVEAIMYRSTKGMYFRPPAAKINNKPIHTAGA